jgi:hypothetical protein
MSTACADCQGPLRLPQGYPSSGERFGFAGMLCIRCYNRHYQRWRWATETRRAPPTGRRWPAPLPALPALPVLNPSVSLDGVTPALACRVILAATRRVFARRATG